MSNQQECPLAGQACKVYQPLEDLVAAGGQVNREQRFRDGQPDGPPILVVRELRKTKATGQDGEPSVVMQPGKVLACGTTLLELACNLTRKVPADEA